jgi:hypothetical protein
VGYVKFSGDLPPKYGFVWYGPSKCLTVSRRWRPPHCFWSFWSKHCWGQESHLPPGMARGRCMYIYNVIHIYICQIVCHVFSINQSINIYISYIITIYRHLHVSACGLHALQDMFCIFQQHSDPRQVLRWLERTVLQDPSPLHTLGPRLTKPAKELESTTLMVGSLSPKKFTQKPNGDSQLWERWQAMQHSSKRILERWWTMRLRGTLWLMTNKNHPPQWFISLRLGKGIRYNTIQWIRMPVFKSTVTLDMLENVHELCGEDHPNHPISRSFLDIWHHGHHPKHLMPRHVGHVQLPRQKQENR